MRGGYVDGELINELKERIDVDIDHMFYFISICTEDTTDKTDMIGCMVDAARFIRGDNPKFLPFKNMVARYTVESPPRDEEVKKMELTLLPFRLYAFLDMLTLQTLINALKDGEFSQYKRFIMQQKTDAAQFQQYAKDLTKWILNAKEGNEKECAEKYWKGHFDVFNTVLSAASAQPPPSSKDAPKESFEEDDQKKEASNQWVDLDVEIIL